MTEENVKNEFEDLDVGDDTPEAEFSNTPDGGSMLSAGKAGEVYDWSNAPDGIKAPPRVDLNGQTVTITKADIVLPAKEKAWDKTKAGDKEFKYCTFVLHYDKEGQQEFHSGCRVFKKMEGDVAKYSHPTITRDRNNQSSKLLGLYSDFKKKDIAEVSLREFLAFLNSKPKAIIATTEVQNPATKEKIYKNLVGKFVE